MIELNSEAQCKTLKYRSDFPTRFGSLEDARNAARADVLTEVYAARAERFVHGLPTPRALPIAAWINPPKP